MYDTRTKGIISRSQQCKNALNFWVACLRRTAFVHWNCAWVGGCVCERADVCCFLLHISERHKKQTATGTLEFNTEFVNTSQKVMPPTCMAKAYFSIFPLADLLLKIRTRIEWQRKKVLLHQNCNRKQNNNTHNTSISYPITKLVTLID